MKKIRVEIFSGNSYGQLADKVNEGIKKASDREKTESFHYQQSAYVLDGDSCFWYTCMVVFYS